MKRSDFKRLCTNWDEVVTDLGLSPKDIPQWISTDYEHYTLRLTYPVSKRENGTDTFTLVRDLVRPGWYTAIDDGLLDVILHLNAEGLTTCYCCEGHMHREHGLQPDGYLMYYPPEDSPSLAASLRKALAAITATNTCIKVEDTPFMGVPRTSITWSFTDEAGKEDILHLLRRELLKVSNTTDDGND